MKKARLFYQVLALGVFAIAAIMYTGCTKDGPTGPAGADGTDGVDGTDGTASCIVCHNQTPLIKNAVAQFELAKHAGLVGFAAPRADCSGCHSGEGATKWLRDEITFDRTDLTFNYEVDFPNPMDCRTCHQVHTNFDLTDLEPVHPETFNLISRNQAFSKGDINTCVKCHQTKYVIPAVDGGDFEITSDRWGAHHSTQGNLRHYDGFEIAGDATYVKEHPHDAGNCIGCHMAEPEGNLRGGHTFSVADNDEQTGEFTDLNYNACKACHTNGEDALLAKMNDLRERIDAKADELRTELLRVGILYVVGGDDRIRELTFPANEAGIYYNYKAVHEDHSGGAHNPVYIEALLVNSLQFAKTLPDNKYTD
ncbi:MAG: hypothetical protein ACEPOZ_16915 [Marinifilaceae bacterium]